MSVEWLPYYPAVIRVEIDSLECLTGEKAILVICDRKLLSLVRARLCSLPYAGEDIFKVDVSIIGFLLRAAVGSEELGTAHVSS